MRLIVLASYSHTLLRPIFTGTGLKLILYEKCTATKGDLLVCEGGDIGRAAIWPYDTDIRIQNHIHRLRSYSEICTEYYYYIFFLYKHAGWIGGKGIGIQGLSANALHSLLFPLPPLSEQHRIVTKIPQTRCRFQPVLFDSTGTRRNFPPRCRRSASNMCREDTAPMTFTRSSAGREERVSCISPEYRPYSALSIVMAPRGRGCAGAGATSRPGSAYWRDS